MNILNIVGPAIGVAAVIISIVNYEKYKTRFAFYAMLISFCGLSVSLSLTLMTAAFALVVK